jgi:hypothetical protein
MAKRQSFADKASKKVHTTVCQVCDSQVEWVRLIDPTYSSGSKSWRFKDKQVGVCKCNEKEIYA